MSLLLPGTSEDLPISHFSVKSFGDWKSTGDAFRMGPAAGDLIRTLRIENSADDFVASSKIEGDRPTGTLTSPPFKIARRFITFLVSGGDYETDTCVNLLINHEVIRSATGRRSDHMMPETWDVSRYRGKEAQIEVVDRATGDWGHIDVDQIMQTDKPHSLPLSAGPLYKEPLRPQFHFTARQWTVDRMNPVEQQEGWVNDLNGLIYYQGEYHLFAQRWAKCWIHAVSRDLIHWTELEPAFWEEGPGSGVQSGTCVIDYENTSGLSPSKSNPPMIAFWSRFDNGSQCICYSLDHGRTWKRYAKNPIMQYPERDPKVFWYAPGNHWVMMLYGEGKYHILTSSNLLDWRDENHPIHDSFECPDFFQLPVDGDKHNMKWVLIQGSGHYSVGTFDGKEFKEETPRFSCDVGPNFYATQTWANTDTGDGRRIQTAWMRGAVFPDMPFNQQISFPCQLTLKSTPNGPRLYREPIHEISLLHERKDAWSHRTLQSNESLSVESVGQLFHIEAKVAIPDGAKLTLNIRGVPVVLTSKTLESGNSPAEVAGHIETVEILVDRASIEAFVNHGEISSTSYVLPKEEGITLTASGGAVILESLVIHKLKSAWSTPRN